MTVGQHAVHTCSVEVSSSTRSTCGLCAQTHVGVGLIYAPVHAARFVVVFAWFTHGSQALGCCFGLIWTSFLILFGPLDFYFDTESSMESKSIKEDGWVRDRV